MISLGSLASGSASDSCGRKLHVVATLVALAAALQWPRPASSAAPAAGLRDAGTGHRTRTEHDDEPVRQQGSWPSFSRLSIVVTSPSLNATAVRPVNTLFASRSMRRALVTPQANPGHAIAAARALESSPWATAGGKGPEICPQRCTLAGYPRARRAEQERLHRRRQSAQSGRGVGVGADADPVAQRDARQGGVCRDVRRAAERDHPRRRRAGSDLRRRRLPASGTVLAGTGWLHAAATRASTTAPAASAAAGAHHGYVYPRRAQPLLQLRSLRGHEPGLQDVGYAESCADPRNKRRTSSYFHWDGLRKETTL